MLKNYFKIALRNLRRSRMYSWINIIGLSTGLGVCILLLLWVRDELSYDRFNVHAANLYRLAPTFNNEGKLNVWDATSAPIAIFAKKELPDVENACRLSPNWAVSYFVYQGKKINE